MNLWGKNFHRIDNAVATLALVLFAALIFFAGPIVPEVVGTTSPLIRLISAFLALYATLLGFTMAVIAFLFGSLSSQKFWPLRESQSYPDHWRVFRGAMRTCAVATLVCSFCLAFAWTGLDGQKLLVVLFGCFIFVVAKIIRVIGIIEKMIAVEVASGHKERLKRSELS